MKTLMFPGQGSQSVGMGADLYKNFELVKKIFKQADEKLNFHLSKIILDGPENELKLTKNTQPAIMTLSFSIYKLIVEEFGIDIKDIKYFCGHSLGEYSALCASGVISLRDSAIILRKRGLAMQKAVPEGEGSMIAVIGMNSQFVNELITLRKCDRELIQVANDNDPSQVVVSGERKEIQKFSAFLREEKAKRIINLPVSAPFHSPLMQPAALVMEAELNQMNFSKPTVPIIQNVDLSILETTEGLVDRLVKQICGTVRWRESLIKMVEESSVNTFFEIGPGKVLAGTVKRTTPQSKAFSVGVSTQIEDAMEIINE